MRDSYITWLSPIADDDYAEYRDDAFVDRLGVTLPVRSLSSFWPRRGPQWDALGRTASGEVVLVEAKAHIDELYSPACAASESSLAKIQLALREATQGLGVPDGVDWSKQFYQYANRLAHAYFLNNVNRVPTKLVFLYFIGDDEVYGPASRHEWESAIALVHAAFGLQRVPEFVVDTFINVRPYLGSAAAAGPVQPPTR